MIHNGTILYSIYMLKTCLIFRQLVLLSIQGNKVFEHEKGSSALLFVPIAFVCLFVYLFACLLVACLIFCFRFLLPYTATVPHISGELVSCNIISNVAGIMSLI